MSDAGSRVHRRVRFPLVGLLLIMGGTVIWWKCVEWLDESRFEGRGITILRDSLDQPSELVLHGESAATADLRPLTRMPTVRKLTLRELKFRQESVLPTLDDCPSVESVYLIKVTITPDAIAAILAMSSIKQLILIECDGFSATELADIVEPMDRRFTLFLNRLVMSPTEFARLLRIDQLSVSIEPVDIEPAANLLNLLWTQPPGMSLTAVEPITAEQLAKLRYPELIECMSGRLAAGASAELRRLRGLETLDLHLADDETLRSIARLTALQSLSINGGELTDTGVSALGSLSHLTHLRISSPKVSGESFAAISTLSRLEFLMIDCKHAAQDSFSHLAELTSLKTLVLLHDQLTSDDIQFLAQLRGLTTIDLYGNPLDERAIEIVESLPNLTGADLRGSAIPEDVLTQFFARLKVREQHRAQAETEPQ
ncbi:MAG: hypothetical protein R3B90_21445 [Planctomycetaceae bacterium]